MRNYVPEELLYTENEIEQLRPLAFKLDEPYDSRTVVGNKEDYKDKRILIRYGKGGLGDVAMGLMLCDIMRHDNRLDVWWGSELKNKDRELYYLHNTNIPHVHYSERLPKYKKVEEQFDIIDWHQYGYHLNRNRDINFLAYTLLKYGLEPNSTPLRGFVVREDLLIKPTRKYDVVMIPNSGDFEPARGYNQQDTLILKETLVKMGHKVLLLSNEQVAKMNMQKLLGIVKNSKVFFSVDTGPMHVCSGVWNHAVIACCRHGRVGGLTYCPYREVTLIDCKRYENRESLGIIKEQYTEQGEKNSQRILYDPVYIANVIDKKIKVMK